MDLFFAPVKFSHLPKTRDPAGQESASPVLLGHSRHGPIPLFPKVGRRAPAGDTPRGGHIEKEEAPRPEGGINSVEQAPESSGRILAVEELTEHLPDGR